MATRANYVKIGLFVVLGFAATLALAVALGATETAHGSPSPSITYFNESVQGTRRGLSRNFRGVRIGRVGDITIAPDHRLVEVRMDIDVAAMERLGIWPKGRSGRGCHVFHRPPADLRAQLGSQGLTGEQVRRDRLLRPEDQPLPALTFPPMRTTSRRRRV